ncbi:hypothetical protein ACWEOZ_08990 [Actinoplanes sp. NPDC004185]
MASAGTVIAYASWPVPSKPVKVKVHAADMPQGVRPSAARRGTDAVVTWSPQEIGPGETMQSYVVKRHDADDASVVKAFAAVTRTTFTEVAVPAGRWYWTVTPRFARWVGEESKRSENVRFTAPAPTSLVADTSSAQAPAPAATGTPRPASEDDPAEAPPAPVETTSPPVPVRTTTLPVVPEETDVAVPPAPPATSSAAAEDEK